MPISSRWGSAILRLHNGSETPSSSRTCAEIACKRDKRVTDLNYEMLWNRIALLQALKIFLYLSLSDSNVKLPCLHSSLSRNIPYSRISSRLYLLCLLLQYIIDLTCLMKCDTCLNLNCKCISDLHKISFPKVSEPSMFHHSVMNVVGVLLLMTQDMAVSWGHGLLLQSDKSVKWVILLNIGRNQTALCCFWFALNSHAGKSWWIVGKR